MDPPIFVFEGGLRHVFASAEAVAARLEWPDVALGLYDAFDSRGRRVTLRVVETPRRLRGFDVVDRVVAVEGAEQEPSGQAELRARLVDYLGSLDLDPAYLAGAALADLVRLVEERAAPRRRAWP